MYSKGDIVEIYGIAEETNLFGGFSVNNCHIISSGKNAENVNQKLKESQADQKEYIDGLISSQEEENKKHAEEEKTKYISNCETVDYNDVKRNPDKYEDRKIKISGNVKQVIEGWFDSETILVAVGENNWYVTYYRSDGESRILEGDFVTVYGKCTGVTSYEALLGNQVTIPSISAEYID